jgi:uncharacterized membrane protein
MQYTSMASGVHTHDGPQVQVSGRAARVLTVLSIVGAVATLVAMVWIGFEPAPAPARADLLTTEVYEAKVVASEVGPCEGTRPEDDVVCNKVTFELTAGPDAGATRTQDFPIGPTTPDLDEGDRVVLSHQADAPAPADYSYADRQRRVVLVALAVAFAVAVVLLGRLRGLGALIGLALSLALIMRFVLPGVLAGHSPVVVAVVAASAIAYLVLYLANGLRPLTTVALLGTLLALGATVALSAIVTAIAEFSGYASEDTVIVELLSGQVDVSGLLLAGIVLGSLGALDDVTVTQVSAVGELSTSNPDLPRRELFRRGLRIGRDHVASTVNTLALAYAGAALPTLLLFVLSRQSLGTVANSEVVAVEIVRTLVGSIGLVLSVPITTWLATLVVSPRPTAPREVGA